MNKEDQERWIMGCLILFFLGLLGTVFAGCFIYNGLVNPLNISVPKDGR